MKTEAKAAIPQLSLLKALLIKEGTKIRGCIANRVAFFITEDEKERPLISRKMKELHYLRSGVLHGRGKKPTFNDTKQLSNYARKTIEKALTLGHFQKKS